MSPFRQAYVVGLICPFPLIGTWFGKNGRTAGTLFPISTRGADYSHQITTPPSAKIW